MVLLEELCHWGCALRFQEMQEIPRAFSLCFVLVDQDAKSQLLFQDHACLPARSYAPCNMTDINFYPSETMSLK